MSTVEITVGGVDLTSIIEYRSAFFDSQVNGQVGRCQFRVKDTPNTQALVSGDEITLDIDGGRTWSGWAMRISRVYYMPVTGTTSVTRYFLIDGADVNLLLQKRYTFSQSDPTEIRGPFYEYAGAPTTDTTALSDLFSDWLDLSGDGIDTSSLVEHVGNINVDQDAYPFGAGQTWALALASIASIEGAIYYIDPDRNLVYTDVDTPNAPFALSDRPTGGDVGYRSAEVFYDGASLINDMLVWGTGKGADHWVFQRAEDATSQSEHGLWQAGEVRFDIYKQATIDKRALTIIDGSPNNKRGRKNDKISVRCKVKEPGLRVAQKVDFESVIHGFSDILPVRRMRTTFPGPSDPLYELELSHEVDVPFDFRDPIILSPLDPLIDLDLPGLVDVTPGECECGITDSFDGREIAKQKHYNGYPGSGDTSATQTIPWGISDAGLQWRVTGFWDYVFSSGGAGIHADGYAFLEQDQGPDGDSNAFLDSVPILQSGAWTVSIRFRAYDDGYGLGGSASAAADFTMTLLGEEFIVNFVRNNTWQVWWGGDDFSFPGAQGVWHLFEVQYDAAMVTDGFTGSLRIRAGSDADPAWSPWIAWGVPFVNNNNVPNFALSISNGSSFSGDMLHVDFDDLNITDTNRCTEYRFDNFNRTVASTSPSFFFNQGWGISDYGLSWNTYSNASNAPFSVNGSQGVVSWTNQSGPVANAVIGLGITGTPWENPAWEMRSQMKIPSVPTAGQGYYQFLFRIESGYGTLELNIGADVNPENITVGDDYVPFTWVGQRNYNILWSVEWNVEYRAKIWLVGAEEPEGWTVTADATGSGTPSGRSLLVRTNGFLSVNKTDTAKWDYIDFDYEGKPCYQDGPVGGEDTVVTSRCIDQTAGAGPDTVYSFPAYAAGTSELFINGLIQRRGIDYYETDPLTGIITLTYPTSSGDAIRFCAQGPEGTGTGGANRNQGPLPL